jgi:GTP-binding protein
MNRVEAKSAEAGDIVAIAGLPDIFVGETIAAKSDAEPLPAIAIDPPSLAMDFMVNDSPFAGREGKFVTSRQIRDRLEKEIETNVGLKIEFSMDSFKVLGRVEMHLAVLLETMRRENYELQVSQPQVVTQEIDGKIHEPYENVVINVSDENSGKIIEALSKRKGEMLDMVSENGQTTLEFLIPTRGLLGFRSTFIILTKGDGTLFHSFAKFAPHCGKIEKRSVGSLISGESGKSSDYALWKLQDRGPIFINPAIEIYEGMIIGEHNQGSDLTVNAVKEKKLTNVRSSGADDAIKLVPPIPISLERALEYIKEDEYVEITPENIRLRKQYLREGDRKRSSK